MHTHSSSKCPGHFQVSSLAASGLAGQPDLARLYLIICHTKTAILQSPGPSVVPIALERLDANQPNLHSSNQHLTRHQVAVTFSRVGLRFLKFRLISRIYLTKMVRGRIIVRP